MDHLRQYNLLIQKALDRTKNDESYYEKHHIIPKSLGGSNAKSNLVYLTGREHFIAHMLLAYIHGGGMWQAAKMMKTASKIQSRKINSRVYEIARKNWSNFLLGKKRPQNVIDAIKKSSIGRKASDETRKKMSEIRKGKPRSGDPKKWKHSEEAKEKMSISHKKINSGSRLPKFFGDENPMKKPEVAAKISASKKLYWENLKAQNNGEKT